MALILLNLLDRRQRTADSIGQRLLGEVKPFALPAQPKETVLSIGYFMSIRLCIPICLPYCIHKGDPWGLNF